MKSWTSKHGSQIFEILDLKSEGVSQTAVFSRTVEAFLLLVASMDRNVSLCIRGKFERKKKQEKLRTPWKA